MRWLLGVVRLRNDFKPGTARFGSALPRCTFFAQRRRSHMLLNQRDELRADFLAWREADFGRGSERAP